MPSLTEKLKSLGVQLGAQNIIARPVENLFTIDKVLKGRTLTTHQGNTYVVEEHHPWGTPLGSGSVKIDAPLDLLGRWAGNEKIASFPPHSFAFIDTETTGLSGGSGTYAFLIGVGRFEADQFHLAQFFMQDPAEESAQLAALEEFLAPCQAIVSFNGKTFDIPLLNTRFTFHGWRSPFPDLAHIDLLHLARRLWRDRLPSRTLGNLEAQILDISRSDEDVPGWMIPEIFFSYLRDGDARPLKSVFYHNAEDVISLVALMNHMAMLLSEPIQNSQAHGVDLIALGRLFEDLREFNMASNLYISGLEHRDIQEERIPTHILLDAISRLAQLHKRQEDLASALTLWEEGVKFNLMDAYIELAKYYEHRERDFLSACEWCQKAIEILEKDENVIKGSTSLPKGMRSQLQEEFLHRLERNQQKLKNRHAS